MNQTPPEPPPLPQNVGKTKFLADKQERVNFLLILGTAPLVVAVLLLTVALFGLRSNNNGIGSGDAGTSAGDNVTTMGVAGEEKPSASPNGQEIADDLSQAESANEPASGNASAAKPKSGDGQVADSEGEVQEPVEEAVISLPSGKVASGATAIKLGDAFNPFLESVTGNEIVYVIDISGSMFGDRNRRVTAELIEALQGLKSTQKFNIVLFSTHAKVFQQDGLVTASKESKDAAGQWLQRQYCGGGTDPTEAMEIAIGMAPSKIVVLSDGEFDGNIPAYVTALNRSLQATIDCIGFDSQSFTLKEVAANNGPGRFYAVQ